MRRVSSPGAPEVITGRRRTNESEADNKVTLARQPYIRADDLEEHGLTRGCPKCGHHIAHGTWGSRPHSQACRARITAAMMQTAKGRARIEAATQRLDRTVEELGQQFRDDVPKGEKRDVVVERHPDFVPPQFIEVPRVADESREVPPSPDDGRLAETRVSDGIPLTTSSNADGDNGAVDVEAIDPGMDIDLVEGSLPVDYHVDTDLMDLMATLTRDAKKEIDESNQEILAVIRSMGGNSKRYQRDRQKAMKAIVSEIYSPPRVTAAVKLLPELKLMPGLCASEP